MDKATAQKAKAVKDYTFYRKNVDDSSDVSFSIKGVHLRWINPRKQEQVADRPWMPFSKEIVKTRWPAFYKELEQKRPYFFKEDGLAYWGNDFLGFMEEDQYKAEKEKLDRENLEQAKRINSAPETADGRFKVKAQVQDSEFGFDDFKK